MTSVITDYRAEDVPFPRAMTRFPTLRQSLLGSFDLCALEAIFESESAFIGDLDDPLRMEWSTHEQGRGTLFHRWAARLLNLLASLGGDRLKDDVECPECGLEPNLKLNEGDSEYQEGNACPHCAKVRPEKDVRLVRKPLTDVALDLLIEVSRQADVEPEDIVTVPQHEKKDLEWIVTKFAREQSFGISTFVAAEERLMSTLEYPNPKGGAVQRVLTGQLDALFVEEEEDGDHAVVIDYKDTWAIPGATSISTDGYWQQRFYAWLVMRTYPTVQRVTLKEVYVRFKAGEQGDENHRSATIERSRLPLIERQLAVVAESFDRAWEAFEEQREVQAEWDGESELREQLAERLAKITRRARALTRPTPGGHCNYCPKPTQCPIAESVRVHGTIHTLEDAERVTGEMTVAKRMVKHRETALKGYLGKGGTDTERAAPLRKSSEGLKTYKDRRPGLPEGVPVKNAKGDKAYAMVEGKRKSSPSREQVEELIMAAGKGVPINLDDYYREVASSTLRLVEPAVPTDDAQEVSPEIEIALAHSMQRLETARRV
jgi:hypothetical protein